MIEVEEMKRSFLISLREQSHDASFGDRAYEARSVGLDTEPDPWSP